MPNQHGGGQVEAGDECDDQDGVHDVLPMVSGWRLDVGVGRLTGIGLLMGFSVWVSEKSLEMDWHCRVTHSEV